MSVKKTWFSYLSIFLFLCGGLLIFVCAVNTLGEGREYPYYVKGMVLVIIAAAYLAVTIFSILCIRLNLKQFAQKHEKHILVAEWFLAFLILMASFALRVWFVRNYPMQPQSDYKTFYEIAILLNKGTLLEDGVGYCDYIAVFPHVLGYSYVLAVVMKIFGSSVWVGQCFNIILAVVTCFFVWRIAVLLAGRVSGMLGLILTAFWPSQIIYNDFLASEYLFSCLLCISIWLFLVLVIKYDANHPHQGTGVFLHVVLGILIALDSAIRPMALLLLISILICLVPSHMPLSIKPRNDLTLSERVMEKGWLRGFILLCTFIATSSFTTKCVSYTIDQEVPGGSVSFGYNLLIGLNQDSYGGWNEADSEYLYSVIEETGSPIQAQIACRDLALQRLKATPKSLLNLAIHKYDVLWSNDDYASTFAINFLEEQGNLTKAREDFLYGIKDYDNLWYMVCVAFSMSAALGLLKKDGNWSYVMIILFLGTIAMHLLVENQNRYHFHALYLLVILTSVGIKHIYESVKEMISTADEKKAWKLQYQCQEELAMSRIMKAQEYANQQMQLSMGESFDIHKAIEEGHIIVSVTKHYAENTTMTDETVQPESDNQEQKAVENAQSESVEKLETDEKFIQEAAITTEEKVDEHEKIEDEYLRITVAETSKKKPKMAEKVVSGNKIKSIRVMTKKRKHQNMITNGRDRKRGA